MTKKQREEMERQRKIDNIRRKLGFPVPDRHYGDPLPEWWAKMESETRFNTKYRGMDGVSVRIR